jgi:hypothetical protein
MANTNAAGTVWNAPNYLGQLFLIGANQTPFLNMIGGMDGARTKVARDYEFALASPYALEAAAQPAITETASLTAPTAWTYVRDQDVNTVQIFQRSVNLSYAKLSRLNNLSGIAVAGDTPSVTDELAFQKAAAMRQMAVDVEYSFLLGAYQKATNAATAAKTRGIVTACSTNTVAAGSAAFSKTLLDQLLRAMAANGAVFQNMVLFANAFVLNGVSDEYAYAPQDRNVGGTAVKTILTDFCTLSVVYSPTITAGTLLVADMAWCAPVVLPVPGKGTMFYEQLSKTGASESGQLFCQCGIDYGPEEYHGTITGLATS